MNSGFTNSDLNKAMFVIVASVVLLIFGIWAEYSWQYRIAKDAARDAIQEAKGK